MLLLLLLSPAAPKSVSTPCRTLPPASEGRPRAAAAETAAAASGVSLPKWGMQQQLQQQQQEEEALPWLHRLCWEIAGGPAAQAKLQQQQQQQQEQQQDVPEELIPVCRDAAGLSLICLVFLCFFCCLFFCLLLSPCVF